MTIGDCAQMAYLQVRSAMRANQWPGAIAWTRGVVSRLQVQPPTWTPHPATAARLRRLVGEARNRMHMARPQDRDELLALVAQIEAIVENAPKVP
jgi:hypothetical protein